MEKDLVDIVMEKSYIELSAGEKAELNEFCNSESEYNQLKDVFLGVEMMQFDAPTPKKETKESLDSLFDSTHPRVTPVWYMSALAVIIPKEKSIHRQPLLQIAAVALLIFIAFPYFQTDVQDSSPQLAELKKTEAAPEVKNTDFKTVEVPTEDNEVVASTIIAEPIATPIVAEVVVPRVITIDPVHPDGVWDEATEMAFSQPASAEPEMLDLLTATF